MKPKEAIKILELPRDDRHFILYEQEREAEKLALEALERLEDWRAGRVTNPDLLLPGETEE